MFRVEVCQRCSTLEHNCFHKVSSARWFLVKTQVFLASTANRSLLRTNLMIKRLIISCDCSKPGAAPVMHTTDLMSFNCSHVGWLDSVSSSEDKNVVSLLVTRSQPAETFYCNMYVDLYMILIILIHFYTFQLVFLQC